jgi:hypothetical protein
LLLVLFGRHGAGGSRVAVLDLEQRLLWWSGQSRAGQLEDATTNEGMRAETRVVFIPVRCGGGRKNCLLTA